MTIQNSTAVRNAYGDVFESTIGVSAKIQLWSGTVPANCAATPAGSKLAEWTLASDWSAAASGGVKALSGVPLGTTGLAAGTVTFYRIVDNAATTCHEQGTVGTSGTDAIMDNLVIAVSQAVNISGWTKTYPGA